MYDFIATTVKGDKRNFNEDRIMINNHLLSRGVLKGEAQETIVAVICDGVGGKSGGAVAAETTANRFKDITVSEITPLWIIQKIDSINREIVKNQTDTIHNSMASTIAGIFMFSNRFLVFNSGDTRIYEVTNNDIIKHTKDHVLYTGKRTLLSNYIGGNGKKCTPYVKKGELVSTESFIVLCSDGIYKCITDIEMHRIIESDLTLKEKSDTILKLSTQKGSNDDKSLIILSINN